MHRHACMTETIATIWGLSMPHALSPEPQTLDLIKFHKPLRRVFVCPFSSWRKQGPRSFRAVVIQPGGGQCGASLLKPVNFPLCPGDSAKKVFRWSQQPLLGQPISRNDVCLDSGPRLAPNLHPQQEHQEGHQRPVGAGETLGFIFLTFLNHHRSLLGRDRAS